MERQEPARARTPERAPARPRTVAVSKAVAAWSALVLALAVPIAVAASSPLLAWRSPVYVVAGLAGVIALALLLVQPLLAGGYLPGLSVAGGRRMHRWLGGGLLAATVLHLAGLWVTSPPDVIDALLFRSPTPFSFWGVIALWAVLATALAAALRRRAREWRLVHTALSSIVVIGTVIHAMQIEGTMGTLSKTVLCALTLAATLWVIVDRRNLILPTRRRGRREG